jgi:hypothetical protein
LATKHGIDLKIIVLVYYLWKGGEDEEEDINSYWMILWKLEENVN